MTKTISTTRTGLAIAIASGSILALGFTGILLHDKSVAEKMPQEASLLANIKDDKLPTGIRPSEGRMEDEHVKLPGETPPTPDHVAGGEAPLPTPIQIIGNEACVTETEQALRHLLTFSPVHSRYVHRHVGIIECVETGSGMYVEETPPRYAAGESTRNAGTIWYASSIVHDACHSQQYNEYRERHPDQTVPREVHFGRAAEAKCNDLQVEALRAIGGTEETIRYIERSLEREYWNDSQRRW